MLSPDIPNRNLLNEALAVVKAIPVEQITCYMDTAPVEGAPGHRSIPNYDPREMIMPPYAVPERYARYDHTEQDVNFERRIYHFHQLIAIKIRIDAKFVGLLDRQFIIEMGTHFDVDTKPDATYIAQLCQYFVHDGQAFPATIAQMQMSDLPSREVSEGIAERYKAESEFYTNPTAVFGEKFECWTVDHGTVLLDGGRYREAYRGNISLGEALKAQYLEPVLQLLIKQWILNQCLKHPQFETLKNNAFFNVDNLEAVIKQYQRSINDKIKVLCYMGMPARREAAKKAAEHNAYGWSALHFQLAQRFSWLRLFVGHGKNDIHASKDPRISLWDKTKFYIDSYLNLSLSRYMVNAIRHNFTQAVADVQAVIEKPNYVAPEGDAQERPLSSKITDYFKAKGNALWYQYGGLFSATYHALKGVYLSLWLPFLASFVAVSGVTSAPFSLLRKMLPIPLGGQVDKAITVVEALKDGALLWFGLPIAHGLFVGAGTAALGSLGMSIGALFMNGLALTVMSPFILMFSPWHYFVTYPRWVIDQYGRHFYQEESDVKQMIKAAAGFGALRVVSIHGFFAVATMAVIAAVGVIGQYYHAAKSVLDQILFNENDLRTETANLNHPQAFRTFLGQLATKLEEHTNVQEDDALLTKLSQCKLTSDEKAELRRFLQDNPGVKEEKPQTTLEIMHMAKPAAFLPSRILVNRLHAELADPQAPAAGLSAGLKAHINAIHDVYESPRFKNVA